MDRRRGLTIVELLVVTAVLALFANLALPGAARLLADASAERTAQRLTAGLAYARLVAVTGGAPVTVCPLDGNGRCDGAWSEGFAVFPDPDRVARLAAGAAPLRVFPASEEQVILRAFRTSRYFRFLPNGQTAWQNGRFTICPRREDVQVRTLVVNVQGRVRRTLPDRSASHCS
jgi:type IV fimbrial biogenesis protein FimT